MAESPRGAHFAKPDNPKDAGDEQFSRPSAGDTSGFEDTYQSSDEQFSDADQQHGFVENQVTTPFEPLSQMNVYLDDHNQPNRGKKSHHPGRVVLVIVLALVAVVGACGFLLYRSAQAVEADAKQITSAASSMKENLTSGDGDMLLANANSFASAAADMHQETSGALWGVASTLPVVGQDVKNAQQLASIADDMGSKVLVPMSQSLSGVSMSSLLSDGKVDVDAIQSLVDALSNVSPTISDCLQRANDIQSGSIAQVNNYVEKAQDLLSTADEAAQTANKIAPSLPGLLGANGTTRTYLIVAQNNSELRATGGLAGARIPVTVSDGAISLGESASLSDGFDVNINITDEERALLGDAPAIAASWSNFTPDFTHAGAYLAEGWNQYHSDQQVEGVIAVDPVFLQNLLALTGGVVASDGTAVDGTNAAQVLLSDIYWKYPEGAKQDAMFAEVAGLCFNQLMTSLGSVGLDDLAKLIRQSGEDRRLQAWMADDTEEAAMKELGVAGELGSDPTQPVLGVYVNDNTWAKMDWYMDLRTTVGAANQNSDGTTTYDVTTTITNRMTDEEAASAPAYITGGSDMTSGAGDMVSLVIVLGPAGGTVSGLDNRGSNGQLEGLDGHYFGVSTKPGETATIEYQVTTAAGASALQVRQTPTARTFTD
ncbi:hypothetical protein AUL39_03660 [Tractidigestivibacter scatoligenes]|uniref:DUF4012 domain-containing protein n=1 Tax=Tractidigestivibacter scatoligenes TaxID=1299998 RepID=A0A100YXB5_TRASO|nr:DUF4012 domain-containing protein [Tractidigestivibacter scatoligenes]KUH59421.1 hypothetical protein AUL39_03660 [Tractidigestivibacter scatoligenes]